MKKQKLTSINLQLKKVNVANLQVIKGGDDMKTYETFCCSEPIVCHPTLTTRPDSIDPVNEDKNKTD